MATIRDSTPYPHFIPINIETIYNRNGAKLSITELKDESLLGEDYVLTGENVIRGIPFHLGNPRRNNVLFLQDKDVIFHFEKPMFAQYLIFIHTAITKPAFPDQDHIPRPTWKTTLIGEKVGDYELLYSDGSTQVVPIRRRFAIGEIQKNWGVECFECVSVTKMIPVPTISESMKVGEAPIEFYGRSQTRIAFNATDWYWWVYALKNENQQKLIAGIRFIPSGGAILLLGLSATKLEGNPLRWNRRQKVQISFSEETSIGSSNLHGCFSGVGIDLGQIISVHPKLDYDNENWENGYNNKPGTKSDRELIVEYCAHPNALLTLGDKDPITLSATITNEVTKRNFRVKLIPPSEQKIEICILDTFSKKPVAAKLHIHDVAGVYLPPVDRHRVPNPFWFEDYSVDCIANGTHFCTYVNGETLVKLPLGKVFIEVSKGFEFIPIRHVYNITPKTTKITIEIDHFLPWREKGWVSADTHVHFLSPQSALLESRGEGVNIVNLLATQLGELLTNVGDFDGQTTFTRKEVGGYGEYMVRVGTENRQHVLGHISLLGYDGQIITPLATGGPNESTLGDAVEVTLSQWAKQCKEQNGIVVLPHFPQPRCEGAATIVLNRVDAIEMTSLGYLYGGISPYSLADWYRYLNCGYFLPAVGGTDKMDAGTAVGTVRTYALIEDEEFTYENWKKAVRSGKTFVTYGPLMEFFVAGKPMGSSIRLPASGGTLDLEWNIETATIPLSKAELVVNGETVEVVSLADTTDKAAGNFCYNFRKSGWAALRVRGGYQDKKEIIVAHSSPVLINVNQSRVFPAADALTILSQIEGAVKFIDSIATRAEANAYRTVKMTLTSAQRLLHNRLHQMGIFHHEYHE